VDAHSASNAISVLIRGFNGYTPTAATPAEYHATVHALKALIGGTLFDYTKLPWSLWSVVAVGAGTPPSIGANMETSGIATAVDADDLSRDVAGLL
jgi:hypothetical protein